MTNNSSSDAVWKWLAATALAVTLGIGGWAWASTIDKLLELDQVSRARGERIAVMETNLHNTRRELLAVQTQLADVNRKLDELLRLSR